MVLVSSLPPSSNLANSSFPADLLTIHESYVRSSVPSSRLHFINIKDGWEPLCKILNCPIPDEPFPKANDANAMQAFFEGVLRDAMVRWLVIFGFLGVGFVFWYWFGALGRIWVGKDHDTRCATTLEGYIDSLGGGLWRPCYIRDGAGQDTYINGTLHWGFRQIKGLGLNTIRCIIAFGREHFWILTRHLGRKEVFFCLFGYPDLIDSLFHRIINIHMSTKYLIRSHICEYSSGLERYTRWIVSP